MSSEVLAGDPFRLSPIATVAACGGLLAAVLFLSTEIVPTRPSFPYVAGAAYLGAASLIVTLAVSRLAAPSFGIANTVTLLRVMLTALLAGLAFEAPSVAVLWFAVVVATVALILDGVDGWVARRRGEASSFGARFDMETDAALMLVLAILVWMLGRSGAWILLAGVLRYAFVGAGLVIERLRRPLPASSRRKTACIVQLVTLVVALGPIIAAPIAVIVAAAGLVLLVFSFALDVIWLLRKSD